VTGAELPSGLAELSVPSALHGERMDRGLALLTGLTRSQAARLISEGRARVGGRPVTSASRRLNQGERLQVDLPARPGRGAGPLGAGPLDGGSEGGASTAAVSRPLATVVYADADVAVVDKPAGLVVHPGAGATGETLVHQLLALFPDMAGAGPDDERPGIVHRIDKGTSGLLVVARTAAARQGLAAQFAAHSAHRRYLAVVHGEVAADEGVVDAPLGRSTRDRVKMAVVEGGRTARTHYQALSRSSAPLSTTLMACRLETGRTHQIRAHMYAIGHPVLGDQRYAKPSLVAAGRQVLPGLRRPWLHAAHLGFQHPGDGRWLAFTSPLPEDLAACLPVLGLVEPDDAV
jgi:23S rRNA pseudouridine1911/1915/1917 synthase